MGQRGRRWGRCRGRSCRCPRAGRRRGTTTGRCTTSTTAAAPPAGSTPATGGWRGRVVVVSHRSLLPSPGRAAGHGACRRGGCRPARPPLAPGVPGRYLLPPPGPAREGFSLPASPAGHLPAAREARGGGHQRGGCFAVRILLPTCAPVCGRRADPHPAAPASTRPRERRVAGRAVPAAAAGSRQGPAERGRGGSVGRRGLGGLGRAAVAHLRRQLCGLGQRGRCGGRWLQGAFLMAPVSLPLPSSLRLLLPALRNSLPVLKS